MKFNTRESKFSSIMRESGNLDARELQAVLGDKGVQVARALSLGAAVFFQKEADFKRDLELGRCPVTNSNRRIVLFFDRTENSRNDLQVDFNNGTINEVVTHFLPGGFQLTVTADKPFNFYDSRFRGLRGTNLEVAYFLSEALAQMRSYVSVVMDQHSSGRKMIVH